MKTPRLSGLLLTITLLVMLNQATDVEHYPDTGLPAGITYSYAVSAYDTARAATIVFSNIATTARKDTSTTIQYDTDIAATGQIEYGLDTNYGNLTEEKGLSYWQQIEITGLTGGEIYHYRIRAKDYEGNETVSEDYSFTTRTEAELEILVRAARDNNDLPNEYYVKTDGDNSNDGLSPETAWQTPSFATQQAEAGDTIYLMDGTWYDEHVMFRYSGIDTHPITLKAHSGTPVLDGVDGTGTGIICSYYPGSYQYSEYITVDGITVKNYDEQIYVRRSSNVHVLNCVVYPNASLTPDGRPGGISIRDDSHYCSINDCTIVGDAHNSLGLYGRVFQPSGWVGIACSHLTVENCTIYDNTLHGLIDMSGLLNKITINNNSLGHTDYDSGTLFMHQGIRYNIAITGNKFINCKGEQSIGLTDVRNAYVGGNYIRDMQGSGIRVYNIDVGEEEGDYESRDLIIHNNEIHNTSKNGVWMLGQNLLTEQNKIYDCGYQEYRFNNDGIIRNEESKSYKINLDAAIVIEYIDGMVFKATTKGEPIYYPEKSSYTFSGKSVVAITTYPITLRPTVAEEYLTVTSVSDTSVTVTSTIATNPTTIGYTNSDYASSYVTLWVDGESSSSALADQEGTVSHYYTGLWSGPHTFTWEAAPRVVSVAPTGALVPLTPTLSIGFSKPMSHTTTEGAISINGGLSPTGFVWRDSDRSVNFAPSTPLTYATTYTVTVNTAATDQEGEHLSVSFSWQFTTRPEVMWQVYLSVVLRGYAAEDVFDGIVRKQSADLPWSTTYDCDDWTQSDGLYSVNCAGLTGYGGWTCSGGEEEQITSDANNPDGQGGKGQRHWEGDGVNVNSGGMKIDFNSSEPELWVRWYMRYESGFQWSPYLHYDKWLYFDVGQTQAVVPQWYGPDKVNIWSARSGNDGQNHPSPEGNGWNTVMGGSDSDGQFHCFEVHLKMDTNGYNGIAEMWVDGVRKIHYTDVDFGTAGGWTYFAIGSNQRYPSNGRCMAVDFDDIAVSNTGYIGPINERKLVLSGAPSDRAIHLTWAVTGTLPVTSTWQIAYDGPPGDQPSPISGIISPTRAYTLTGLTNYTFYTVTLNAMSGSASLLADTVTVMPSDISIYLPVALKGR